MSDRIDEGLVSLVSSKTAITDIIGTSPMRFFPKKLPQETSYPAVAYKITHNEGRPTFDGASKYDFCHVDLQCYGKKYSDVFNLWTVLRSELEDTVGTFNSVNITHIWYMPSGAEGYLETLELETKQLELKIGYTRTT